MQPLRITDGYTELAATTEKTMLEVFVQEEVQDSYTSFRLTEPVAVRLAWWIIKWWITERLFGFKARKEAKQLKASLNL